ncbi:TPA: Rpn family recombination-promoting nuclease/putative transposase [Bacillus pacificus]|nr:Rpn family recombination-promoting nuclease/putative transposase [Bacillus pacificus]
MSSQQLVNLRIDFAFKQLLFVRWLLLLPANEDEQLTQTLEDIAMNHDPILQKAMNKWERMSQDSSFRQAYEVREKALMDEAAKFAHARNEGKKEGIEEGKIQLIRGMHKNGMTIEDIAKFTNLRLEEIRSIVQV